MPIHGFSWHEALAHHQLPVHLENDANCVGLSRLLAHQRLKMQPVSWWDEVGGAMIINGKLHRGRHGLGEDLAMTAPLNQQKSSNNWSQLASTGNMARCVIENLVGADWDGRKIYQRPQPEMPFAKSH